MRNYQSYQGKRAKRLAKRLLTVVLTLILIGMLAFFILLGIVLAGSHDQVSGQPSVMIVLGCQVRPDGPSILLQDRIDEAAAYLLDHPEVTVVASGGQGPDEPMSEARAIRDALVEQGVEAERILLEVASHNTVQNLRYSKALLEEAGIDTSGGVLVVSNGFHLARVRMLAARCGFGQVSTLAAPESHLPSRLAMYIREPLALVKSFLLDR